MPAKPYRGGSKRKRLTPKQKRGKRAEYGKAVFGPILSDREVAWDARVAAEERAAKEEVPASVEVTKEGI